MRINGDKSTRLIYNGAPTGNTCPGNGSSSSNVVLSGTAYNENSNNSSYVGWTYSVGEQRPSNANPQANGTESTIKMALENWYSSNISTSAKSKVATGKFCNDRNTKDNETWRPTGSDQYYAAYQRVLCYDHYPTLECSNGDLYELKIGLITADETVFAGTRLNTSNTEYYLYNGQNYWTMTPERWFGNGTANVYFIDGTYGDVDGNYVHQNFSARPVINLRSDVTFNPKSDGTSTNPYIVQ